MAFVSTDSVLKIRADAVEVVRKHVDLHRPGEMDSAVGILEEWIRQQPHFKKKEFPSEYLESTIIASKGSVERAKKIIDKLCTLRTLMPEEFRPFDFRKEVEPLKGNAQLLFLPKQTEDHYRVVVIRTTEYTPTILHLFYKACYLLVDYMRMYDHQRGVDVIYDLSNSDVKDAVANINFSEFANCYEIVNLVDYMRMYDHQRGVDVIYDLSNSDVKDAVANINFSEFANCYEIVNHSYTVRFRRFIVITPSKWVEPLLNLMKAFMKKKIADRIVVHKSIDDLLEYYPKEILPKDYGGDDSCLKDLQEELLIHITSKKHQKFIQDMFEASTDESLRAQDVFNDLYAGTAGTFRTLKLD